jgi:hypothetical protein
MTQDLAYDSDEYSASVLFIPEEIMEEARKLVQDFVYGRACFASRWEYLTWRKSRGSLSLLDPRWQIGALHAMVIVRFLCPSQKDRNAVWRSLLAKEIWEKADKAGLSRSAKCYVEEKYSKKIKNIHYSPEIQLKTAVRVHARVHLIEVVKPSQMALAQAQPECFRLNLID